MKLSTIEVLAKLSWDLARKEKLAMAAGLKELAEGYDAYGRIITDIIWSEGYVHEFLDIVMTLHKEEKQKESANDVASFRIGELREALSQRTGMPEDEIDEMLDGIRIRGARE